MTVLAVLWGIAAGIMVGAWIGIDHMNRMAAVWRPRADSIESAARILVQNRHDVESVRCRVFTRDVDRLREALEG